MDYSTIIIWGSLAGIAFLAVYVNFTFKKLMFFLPLLCLVSIQLIYRLSIFIVEDIGLVKRPNKFVIFFDGFFDSPIQFYMYFLSPLRIADNYRVSQEVTPAATLIAVIFVISDLSSDLVCVICDYLIKAFNIYTNPTNILFPIVFGIVSIIIIWSVAIEEVSDALERRRVKQRIEEVK